MLEDPLPSDPRLVCRSRSPSSHTSERTPRRFSSTPHHHHHPRSTSCCSGSSEGESVTNTASSSSSFAGEVVQPPRRGLRFPAPPSSSPPQPQADSPTTTSRLYGRQKRSTLEGAPDRGSSLALVEPCVSIPVHVPVLSSPPPRDSDSIFTLRDDIPFTLALLLLFSAAAQSYYAAIISILLNREVGYGPLEITRYWLFLSFSSWFSPFVSQRLSVVYLPAKHALTYNILSTLGVSLVYGMVPASTRHFGILLLLSAYSQLCLAGQYSLLNQYVREAGRCEGETSVEEAARQAKLLSQTMIWRSVGTVMGAVAQCYGLYRTSVRNVASLAAVLFALLLPLAWMLPRDVTQLRPKGRETDEQRMLASFKVTFHEFHRTLLRRKDRSRDGGAFVVVLAFVFVCTMLPDSGNVYYNYLYSYNFPAWYYSILNGVGHCGATLGASLFSRWMHKGSKAASTSTDNKRSAFSLFVLGILCWVMSHVCNLLLVGDLSYSVSSPSTDIAAARWAFSFGTASSMWSAVCGSLLVSLFSRLAFLPTMVIASEHTPPAFRMTSMEVLGVICTVGGTVSAFLTYELLVLLHRNPHRPEHNLLAWTVVICGASKFLLIPFAYLLPKFTCSTSTPPPRGGGEFPLSPYSDYPSRSDAMHSSVENWTSESVAPAIITSGVKANDVRHLRAAVEGESSSPLVVSTVSPTFCITSASRARSHSEGLRHHSNSGSSRDSNAWVGAPHPYPYTESERHHRCHHRLPSEVAAVSIPSEHGGPPNHDTNEIDVVISDGSVQWGDMVFEVPDSYAQCTLPQSSDSSWETS